MLRMVLVLGVLTLHSLPAHAVDSKAIDDCVERGVNALKRAQQSDGSWQFHEVGATALAALTLLECGVPKTDKSITSAANYIREKSLTVTQTYSISLAILFFELLDEPNDVPLVESLIVRLLAGQMASGAYSYTCPAIGEAEQKRLRTEMAGGPRVLRAGKSLSKLPAKGTRTAKDLAPEIQDQLASIARGGGFDKVPGAMGDNSNTQFATTALWVGRRYGVPTQGALIKIHDYFRATQQRDGGWPYNPPPPSVGGAVYATLPSTPSMTCAGIFGLACGHGSAHDIKKTRDAKVDKQDITKDRSIVLGLQALSTAVGNPIGWTGTGPRPVGVPGASERAFYYLWSLERVCVTLNLKTIGKKDWYNWGAEILLANQAPDGTWRGSHSEYGADTCFALLFLRKANFTRDLAGSLRGFADPGARTIRAGGLGGGSLKDNPVDLKPTGIGKNAKSGNGRETARKPEGSRLTPPRETRPGERARARSPEEEAAGRLTDEAVRASGERRRTVLDRLRDTRGVAYTEALVEAIGRLDADGRREARVALAQRFTRLKDSTLRTYLEDVEPEIRRAAALASAARGAKAHVPDLIRLLEDRDGLVARAAHEALKTLTGKDFGPARDASPEDRRRAVASWQKWHRESSRE